MNKETPTGMEAIIEWAIVNFDDDLLKFVAAITKLTGEENIILKKTIDVWKKRLPDGNSPAEEVGLIQITIIMLERLLKLDTNNL